MYTNVLAMFLAVMLIAMAQFYSDDKLIPRRGLVEGFRTNDFVGIDYEVFFAIVQAYRRILERPPTEEEIQQSKKRLGEDLEYTMRDLERDLLASDEFRRLVSLQKNATYAESGAIITEDEIRRKIAEAYRKASGGQEPDAVTMEFLYSRYRASTLNDAYLAALCEQIVMDEAQAVSAAAGTEIDPATGLPVVLTPDPNGTGSLTSTDAGADADAGADPGADPASGTTIEAAAAASAYQKLLAELGLTESDVQGGPDAVTDALLKFTDGLRTECKRNGDINRRIDLLRAGYIDGPPVDSWLLPQPISPPVCVGGAPTVAPTAGGPSASLAVGSTAGSPVQ